MKMAVRDELRARVEQAWGSTLLSDSTKVAQSRDVLAKELSKLSDRFFKDFQKATGQELQLHHLNGRWGIVYQKHILVSVREMISAFGDKAVAKVFGKMPSEQEFRSFMDLVTIQFQINEGQD